MNRILKLRFNHLIVKATLSFPRFDGGEAGRRAPDVKLYYHRFLPEDPMLLENTREDKTRENPPRSLPRIETLFIPISFLFFSFVFILTRRSSRRRFASILTRRSSRRRFAVGFFMVLLDFIHRISGSPGVGRRIYGDLK